MQRIGIDFDNTIAGYDHIFQRLAEQWGLIPGNFAGGKKAIRDAIRESSDGELAWQKLQGVVYGRAMQDANLINGVDQFLSKCKSQGVSVFIISHKTRYGHFDDSKTDLRVSATRWMENKGFFSHQGFGLMRENVHFSDTRGDKLHVIAKLNIDVFIDDLEEIFLDREFPSHVAQYLYSKTPSKNNNATYKVFSQWKDILDDIFETG